MKTKWVAIAGAGFFAVLAGLYLNYVWVSNLVEQIEYTALDRKGDFAVRSYPELLVAEVYLDGTREEALNEGRRILSRYISAKDRAGDTIPRAAPVLQQEVLSARGRWAVSFVMPAEYSLRSLPKPEGAASRKITLRLIPPRRIAVKRFGNVPTDRSIAEAEVALRVWMAEKEIASRQASAAFAFYNDPYTPWFMRRNEVWLEVGG